MDYTTPDFRSSLDQEDRGFHLSHCILPLLLTLFGMEFEQEQAHIVTMHCTCACRAVADGFHFGIQWCGALTGPYDSKMNDWLAEAM